MEQSEINIELVTTSRSVHAFGYDEPSQTLYVHLYKSGWHKYDNVTPGEAQTIRNAPSIGTTLFIILKSHLFKRLSAVDPEFKRLKYNA